MKLEREDRKYDYESNEKCRENRDDEFAIFLIFSSCFIRYSRWEVICISEFHERFLRRDTVYTLFEVRIDGDLDITIFP